MCVWAQLLTSVSTQGDRLQPLQTQDTPCRYYSNRKMQQQQEEGKLYYCVRKTIFETKKTVVKLISPWRAWTAPQSLKENAAKKRQITRRARTRERERGGAGGGEESERENESERAREDTEWPNFGCELGREDTRDFFVSGLSFSFSSGRWTWEPLVPSQRRYSTGQRTGYIPSWSPQQCWAGTKKCWSS